MSIIARPPSSWNSILILSHLPTQRNSKRSLLTFCSTTAWVGSGVKMYISWETRRLLIKVIFPNKVNLLSCHNSITFFIFTILLLQLDRAFIRFYPLQTILLMWKLSLLPWRYRACCQPEKTANIWRCYHWFPRQMTSAEIPQWWRITTQIWTVLLIGWNKFPTRYDQSEALLSRIWVVTRHQYGISALFSWTSFGGETTGGVAKCWLFSQTSLLHSIDVCHTTAILSQEI